MFDTQGNETLRKTWLLMQYFLRLKNGHEITRRLSGYMCIEMFHQFIFNCAGKPFMELD